MTSMQSFLNNIRNLIGKGDTKTALRQLKQFLKDSPQLDEALMHAARFQNVIHHIHLGIIDFDTAAITKNQINNSILELIREIEEQSHSPSIEAEINEAALVAEDIFEYNKIKEKTFVNRGEDTSELLKDKTTTDLDDIELGHFFDLERVALCFDGDKAVLKNMNSQQRLVHLSLAENEHLFKGTFLCFGQPNQIQTISQSATESKFILFKGTERNPCLLF